MTPPTQATVERAGADGQSLPFDKPATVAGGNDTAPPETVTGHITAFYAFDVAEAVSFPALVQGLGEAMRPEPLAPRAAAPAHLQYQQPPLVIDGAALGLAEIQGFRTRFKIFDYGVVSMSLRRPFSGSWADLTSATSGLLSDQALPRDVGRACRRLVERIAPALAQPHDRGVPEDYIAITLTGGGETADDLLCERGMEIAQVVLGERGPLSTQERDEALAHKMSYLTNDLVVPTWSAAFLYDRDAGAESTLDILEFANSQLLEFRYYDQRLDAELTRIYAELQASRQYAAWLWRRYERTARQLHSLFIEVSELTERTENALKFIGDAHAARLFALVASRMGLNAWKASVRGKLEMLDRIYRFTVERSAMARGQVLELAIVLILVFELVLVFMGVLA